MNSQQLTLLQKTFPSLPIKEKEIIQRVLSGEDLRIIDINLARKNYRKFKSLFPDTNIYVAVKAHGAKGIIEMLREENSHFEVATIEELESLIQKKIPPEKILFTHPAKDSLEINKATQMGVNRFVSDSENDIQCIAKEAPHSFVLIRITTEDKFKNTNSTVRFGANPETAKKLILLAKKLKLKPYGIAFHVGVQTEKPEAWESPIKNSAKIFKEMKARGIVLDTLDMGGGFPAQYKNIPKLEEYQKVISQNLDLFFKDIPLKEKIIEPGTGISGLAGITIGRVIHVKKSTQNPEKKIITLSTGRYSAGLLGIGLETLFYTKDKNQNFYQVPEKDICSPADFFGKACSHLDKIFNEEQKAPSQIQSGDIVMFRGTGAYAGEIASKWCYKTNPTDIIFDSKTS